MNAKDAIIMFLPHVKTFDQIKGRNLNIPVDKIVEFMEDYAKLKVDEDRSLRTKKEKEVITHTD